MITPVQGVPFHDKVDAIPTKDGRVGKAIDHSADQGPFM
jgi:hypothetical protein